MPWRPYGQRSAQARSARVLHTWYHQRSSELEPEDAQYREWEHITDPPGGWPSPPMLNCAAANPVRRLNR